MSAAATTTLVNWNDLWRIVVAALVGGFGVAVVFGILLVGLSRGRCATRPTARCGLYAVSAVCGALVVATAAVGVYAMTQKRSSPRAKPSAAAPGTVAPAARPGHAERHI
jgi:hypothetical protein